MANKKMKWFSIATLACAASLCIGFGAANVTADAAATLDGFKISSTSVRLDDPTKEGVDSGLRFKVDLPSNVARADIENAYTMVTLIPEAGAFEGQVQTTKVPATVWRKDNSGWNTVLLQIPETDYITEVTAQAFVTIDGVEYPTEAETSSIAKTAQSAIDNKLATEEEVGHYIPETEVGVVATFEFGANGDASHADGSSAGSYKETNGGYTLDITGAVKMSTGVRDAKGNSAIRFGTSSAIGSMSFMVPADVSKVILYVAQYKTNAAKIKINGTSYDVKTASDNGEYTAYEVDTSTSKTVSFETVSGGARCVVNTIEFVGGAEKVPFYTTKVNAAKAAVADLFANEYSKGATVTVPVEAPYNGTFDWKVEAGAEAATIDGDQVSIKQSTTEDVTVTISATYTQDDKTVTIASETFLVKKAEVNAPQWTLVTNVNQLKENAQVIIVSKEYNKALSTTQNNNNRGKADVTKENDIIPSIGDDVQILTLKTGKNDGTFAFYTGDAGYLYAASSSSNHLKTKTTLDANGSWKITVTSAGVATIKATGSNTKNWLRYNNQNSIFSCYSSGQADICLYVLE